MTEGEENLRQVNIRLHPVQVGREEVEELDHLSQSTQTLDIYGVKINVCTSLPPFSEELSSNYTRFFSHLSPHPDATVHFFMGGEDVPLVRSLRAKNTTDVLELAAGARRAYVIPATEELGNFFLSVMQVALFRILLDYHLFCAHASAASAGTDGILISGESNTGKTTLVMALLAEGCKYFSDDMVLINTDTMMLLPLCSRLKPRGETISMFPQINLEEARSYMETENQERRVLSVEHSSPHLLGDPCPLTHIFFPTFNPERETAFRLLSSSDAVLNFLKSWKLYSTEPRRVFPLVNKVVRACKAYSMVYRDAREASRKMIQIVSGVSDGQSP